MLVVGRDEKTWSIDRFACVTCGLCVRVCPKKCLRMEAERPAAAAFADLAGRVELHESPAAPPAAPPGGADA